jgi:hypothetical protein
MKINIKCLIPYTENKIKVIKLLRGAFNIGLKDAKDLGDKFNSAEVITYESDTKFSIKQLNEQQSRSGGNRLLQYSGGQFRNGFDREAFLEKVKFFAGLALDNDESQIAEDLLHIYNKHAE